MTPTQLKHIRKRLGLTQTGLGDLLGVDRNTITRWEMGLHPIPQTASKLLVLILASQAKWPCTWNMGGL
jgi:DNA-binding transcriptional regulator YiaG